MQKLTILTVMLLMIAPVTSAQVTAGPVGPFVMVDADGDLMGGAVPIEHTRWAVALNTSVARGFVEVARPGQTGPVEHLGLFIESDLYFASSNCMGQPYINLSILEGLDGGPNLAVNDQTLYASTNSASSVTIASFKASHGSGLCQPYSGPDQGPLLPVTTVGSLANTFTPPFRIVTAGSQTASVPILGHVSQWLLAAALIGAFVLYDRRRVLASTAT